MAITPRQSLLFDNELPRAYYYQPEPPLYDPTQHYTYSVVRLFADHFLDAL